MVKLTRVTKISNIATKKSYTENLILKSEHLTIILRDDAFAIRTVLGKRLRLKSSVLHLKDVQEVKFLRE